MEDHRRESDLPVWRRERLFSEKPKDAPYGVLLRKGQARTFATFEELEAHVADWKESAELIWTEESERCFPPEEDPRLLNVLRKRKSSISEDDWGAFRYRAFIFLLPIVYFFWKGLSEGRILRSQELGLFGVLWLMFCGIPAYEAWWGKKRAIKLNAENLTNEAQEVRFEIWLRRQSIPLTKMILGALIGVFVVQILRGY